MTNGDFFMVSIEVDRALELLVGLRRACRVCDVRDVEPALDGLAHVIEDVRAIVRPVMRHRIVTNFSATAEGMTADHIVERLLSEVDPSASVGAGLPGVRAPQKG